MPARLARFISCSFVTPPDCVRLDVERDVLRLCVRAWPRTGALPRTFVRELLDRAVVFAAGLRALVVLFRAVVFGAALFAVVVLLRAVVFGLLAVVRLAAVPLRDDVVRLADVPVPLRAVVLREVVFFAPVPVLRADVPVRFAVVPRVVRDVLWGMRASSLSRLPSSSD